MRRATAVVALLAFLAVVPPLETRAGAFGKKNYTAIEFINDGDYETTVSLSLGIAPVLLVKDGEVELGVIGIERKLEPGSRIRIKASDALSDEYNPSAKKLKVYVNWKHHNEALGPKRATGGFFAKPITLVRGKRRKEKVLTVKVGYLDIEVGSKE